MQAAGPYMDVKQEGDWRLQMEVDVRETFRRVAFQHS